MNLHALKLSLIEKLLRVQDEQKLRKLEAAIDEKQEPWDLMSEGERKAFEEGVRDYEAGRVISVEQADKELYEEFPDLAP